MITIQNYPVQIKHVAIQKLPEPLRQEYRSIEEELKMYNLNWNQYVELSDKEYIELYVKKLNQALVTKPQAPKEPKATPVVKPSPVVKPVVVKEPKAQKKTKAKTVPSADKSTEKARTELRQLKVQNAAYEKKILFDADFLSSLLKQTQQYTQSQRGLGALPTELSQELKKERALNTLYRQVMKRNVKAFKSLEVRLKKSNEVTPAMERKFMQLYSTLNGLKQSAVAKRRVTVKKKKGFLAELFS